MQKRLLKTGYIFLKIIMGIIVAAFMIYAFFTLWDMYRTEISAFNSYDLLKYRPDIENDEPPYLDELVKINPDTAAWLTIYADCISKSGQQARWLDLRIKCWTECYRMLCDRKRGMAHFVLRCPTLS